MTGRDDDDRHQQVSGSAAAEAGHSLSGNADHIAALNSTFEMVRNGAIQRRNVNVAAQGRLAHRDRHLANQVDAVALKERMFSNADQAIKIAAGSAAVARFPLAAQANSRAG